MLPSVAGRRKSAAPFGSDVLPQNTTLTHMHIELDDVTGPQVLDLLREHLANMYELSPPDQVFAFDASKLQAPDVTFWTVWQGDELLGCGALKELDPQHGEVKSMRTPRAARRKGAGKNVIEHVIATACTRAMALCDVARSRRTRKTRTVCS